MMSPLSVTRTPALRLPTSLPAPLAPANRAKELASCRDQCGGDLDNGYSPLGLQSKPQLDDSHPLNQQRPARTLLRIKRCSPIRRCHRRGQLEARPQVAWARNRKLEANSRVGIELGAATAGAHFERRPPRPGSARRNDAVEHPACPSRAEQPSVQGANSRGWPARGMGLFQDALTQRVFERWIGEGESTLEEPPRGRPRACQQQRIGHLAEGQPSRKRAGGYRVGRRSGVASVLVNSRFVTGFGATPFTAPSSPPSPSRWRIAATRSSSAIQLIDCRPFPTRPPAPIRNGPSILASAPPRAEHHAGSQWVTRIPRLRTSSAASSHSLQTSARNSVPGGLDSSKTSSPRSP